LMGSDLGGCRVLDAFAGSGALGLEALSRGASHATFVDSAAFALRAIEANVESLGAGPHARVARGDAFRMASSGAVPGAPFGLLLVDPPYRIGSAQVASFLADLARTGLLGPDAVVVWEHAADEEADWPDGFEPVRSKRYGTTAFDIATYRGGPGPA
ncbi:MAG: methyltransferase, partial [Actinobacteria bacterium]